MSKQQPAARAAIAVSPSLSMREAVRPLIFAHALLTREQDLAGELARECRKLEKLTREALEAAALVHLLAPDTVTDDTDISRRDRLIGAYAKAATSWAEVTGTAIALADALLEAGRADDVYRLAGFLEAAGEPTAAKDLSARADAATKRASEARLAQIHADMTGSEIAAAIEALRDSKDQTAASFYIRDLAQAMTALLASHEEEYVYDFGNDAWQIVWRVAPGDMVPVGNSLCNMRYVGHSSSPHSRMTIYGGSGAPFSLVVSKLLVPEGHEVSGSVTIASVIRAPDPIMAELGKQQPDRREVFTRLDTLARVFWRIQTENAKSASASEQ